MAVSFEGEQKNDFNSKSPQPIFHLFDQYEVFLKNFPKIYEGNISAHTHFLEVPLPKRFSAYLRETGYIL